MAKMTVPVENVETLIIGGGLSGVYAARLPATYRGRWGSFQATDPRRARTVGKKPSNGCWFA